MTEYVHACQIGAVGAAPAVGAELWYLSHDTYGRQTDTGYANAPESGTGSAAALLVRTQPIAPAGKSGKTVVRRLYVLCGYQFGGFSVEITPILDFGLRLAPFTAAYADPATQTQQIVEIEVPIARLCTWVQGEIVLVTWAGRIELLGVEIAHRAITVAAASVVGVE
jgi:hypothetical protein